MSAPQPSAAPSRGGLLTEKLGPLAVWVWLLIVTVALGAYYLYEKHKAASTASTAATTSASQVPDYIVQNYLGNTPSGGTTGDGTGTPPAGSVPPDQPVPVASKQPVIVAKQPPASRKTVPPPKSGFIEANGRETLHNIAAAHGITEQALISANPALRKLYYGSGKNLPAKTRVKIPK